MPRQTHEPHEDSEAAEIARAYNRRGHEPEPETEPKVRQVPVQGEPAGDELESPQAYRQVPTCRGRSLAELEDQWREEHEAEKRGEAPKGPTFAELAARMGAKRRGGAA